MTPLDVTKPNIARMYDYWLGGKDNFEADREAAEAIRRQRPNIAEQALDNKKFQTRAISYVAGQGVRQFLDAETAQGVVARFARALAPGSYLIISIGWAKGQDGQDFASTYNAQDGSRVYAHSRDDITAMFDGTDLVSPGIVDCATWRVDPAPAGPADQTSMILGAVARRP
ncbi:MAG TPA: SAM-dependent methyltransferase [Streptosporangiaceae bacterium]|jgi:predicted transcriptional regulator|nr:SAM-dependent methyltransferase [Streptosporangiaceae bacterium]